MPVADTAWRGWRDTYAKKIGDTDVATNEGEQVLDALLLLGYSIEISDEGNVTATKGVDVLHGNAESGTISGPTVR